MTQPLVAEQPGRAGVLRRVPGSVARSGGRLGIVIGLHLGVFLLFMASQADFPPQIVDRPLIVDLLPAVAAPKVPPARPLPVVAPRPPRQTPAVAPKTPIPLLAPTPSDIPAPAAPLVAAPEPKPATVAATATAAAEPLSPARFDADYLNNPAPAYPLLARRLGEEGQVMLRVGVNAQGHPDSVEVETSSGSTRLDAAAVNTVNRWKFMPARRGNGAVSSWVLVPIIFRLEQ